MTSGAIHDQKLLREEAYVDDSCLDVRSRTHQLFTVDPVDFGEWTLGWLDWQGGECVLDVGCGPGELLCSMASRRRGWGRLVGIDLSPGMVSKGTLLARGLQVRFAVSDAQCIPFASGSFDVVMARHMLYHVPDIDRAVAEAARVLRPGGRFLAVTNSSQTMPQYWALRCKVAERFPISVLPQERPERFSLENGGSYLSRHFVRLESHTLPGTLRFHSAQPLVDYFASSRALTMRPGHTEAQWQAVIEFVRSEIETVIAQRRWFDVSKLTGALVGLKRD